MSIVNRDPAFFAAVGADLHACTVGEDDANIAVERFDTLHGLPNMFVNLLLQLLHRAHVDSPY